MPAKKPTEQPAQPERREGQEGSRWVNVRPTGEQLAAWFKENVSIPEGLKHEDYVSGVTLIQQTEKSKEIVAWSPEGQPVIAERSNLVFVPYAKVETRVKYFHDLMALHADEWQGVIQPVSVPEPDKSLPPGFFFMLVPTGENRGVRYICSTMKVTVFKRGTVERVEQERPVGVHRNPVTRVVGETIIDAPPATKMIPVSGNRGPDNFSLMKAETGAIGRALGLAGMLVIPGTGVATAEDMAEAEALDRAPQPQATAEGAEVPQEGKSPEQVISDLRQSAAEAISALKTEFPARFEDFRTWAQERGIGRIDEINDEPKLRGLVTKAERELQDARAEEEPPPSE